MPSMCGREFDGACEPRRSCMVVLQLLPRNWRPYHVHMLAQSEQQMDMGELDHMKYINASLAGWHPAAD